MKKKFSIWLNIVTICLCVCAIAIGVYAANTATLKVSGQIGFTAHGCNVDVSGYIYGHAQGDVENGVPIDAPTAENDRIKLEAATQGDSDTSTKYISEIRGVAGSLKVGRRYFSDLESTDGKPQDIVIVITAINRSNFAIEPEIGTIVTPSVNVTANIVASTTGAISQNAEIIFTITLSLTGTNNNYANIEMPAQDAAANLSIPITFKKSTKHTVTVNLTESLGTDRMGYNTFQAAFFIVDGVGEEDSALAPRLNESGQLILSAQNTIKIRFLFNLDEMSGYLTIIINDEIKVNNYDLRSLDIPVYHTEEYTLLSDFVIEIYLSDSSV